MERAMTGRRAALDGLARILDAGAPEELFAGPEEEAHFLYGLLVDTARARASAHYWEICRTARRRGVTPEYVVDRAAVLLATIEERRRTDLYRILGVRPLSSGETIREHWLELARQHHPDVGGDGGRGRRPRARARPAPHAGEPQARPRGIGAASARRGGSSAGVSRRASAASQGAVAASRPATSSAGSVVVGTLARRLRPSARRLRAPRRFPCAR